ncbi:MAG TPA: phytoene/squalene synthase family protein [Polyangiaceae bacterium]|nr:phytoene/squalene synthase family protein [Polyangiaceae bacterium]
MPTPSPDLVACRELIRRGSRSFFLASRLLPERVRWPAYALYGFCRVADDEVDEGAGGGLARVEGLARRLDRAYAGAPREHPVDRALAAAVRAHGLPRAAFDAMLEGFRWDVEGRPYDGFDELAAYCVRVAATVGVLMTVLMGPRDRATLARACDLGVAMQLTNVARDVGEDARRGRLYLPRAWLRDAGLDPDAFLARPAFSPELAGVVRRLLGEAAVLYRRADAGIARLPADCRWSIATARRVYAAIGNHVARAGFDTVGRRAVVPTGHKLRLAGAAGLGLGRRRPDVELAPPLAAAAFLCEAASA